MQEQTYPSQRPDAAPMPPGDDQRAREEWKRQLDRMLDEYRVRFVLRKDPRGETLSGSVFDGG
jgi:hypothetical protein